jgi:methanogenic corrinoid protein MtbC1
MIREVVYLGFLDALLQGDRIRCRQIIADVIGQGADIREIYIHIFQKALYRVGRLWEQNKLSIAEEHMASQIIDSLVTTAFASLPPQSACGKRCVVTCIDKEFHQIGAKMVSNIFELNGWSSFYLGGNIPWKEVLEVIKEKQPHIVAISFSFYMNYLRFLESLDHISKEFPDKQIIVGGQGLNEELIEILGQNYPKVIHFSSIHELDRYLQEGH